MMKNFLLLGIFVLFLHDSNSQTSADSTDKKHFSVTLNLFNIFPPSYNENTEEKIKSLNPGIGLSVEYLFRFHNKIVLKPGLGYIYTFYNYEFSLNNPSEFVVDANIGIGEVSLLLTLNYYLNKKFYFTFGISRDIVLNRTINNSSQSNFFTYHDFNGNDALGDFFDFKSSLINKYKFELGIGNSFNINKLQAFSELCIIYRDGYQNTYLYNTANCILVNKFYPNLKIGLLF